MFSIEIFNTKASHIVHVHWALWQRGLFYNSDQLTVCYPVSYTTSFQDSTSVTVHDPLQIYERNRCFIRAALLTLDIGGARMVQIQSSASPDLTLFSSSTWLDLIIPSDPDISNWQSDGRRQQRQLN